MLTIQIGLRSVRDRSAQRKQKRLASRNPALPVVDASKFSQPLSVLAEAMTNLVEREGPRILTSSPVPVDTGIILRQLTHTYDLLRFINGDEPVTKSPIPYLVQLCMPPVSPYDDRRILQLHGFSG